MDKEQVIKLIEERKCKLLVKVKDSDKEFKVNVSKHPDKDIDYKVMTNVFLEYNKELDFETLDFWTGEWYFDDLFNSTENLKWKWEIIE